jgi:hypothetical protein
LGAAWVHLLREAGFEHIDQRPSYSAALADVKAGARAMLSALERPEACACAITDEGITSAQFDGLASEITTWAGSQDSIAAFAECSAIASKPEYAPQTRPVIHTRTWRMHQLPNRLKRGQHSTTACKP